MSFQISNIRDCVIGADRNFELQGGGLRPLINFDNAATTPALRPVMDAVNEELAMYGAIGRSLSQKSSHSTALYNEIRKKILAFTGADPDEYSCFYVSNTTDGINKLASALIESREDIVLATRMEHHSNDLPWRARCKVIYAETDSMGRLDYDSLEDKLRKYAVKYVTVTAASNVTGYINDVHRIAALAHKYGAGIIVDGAQIVAHREFSVMGDAFDEDIDYFVFSSHKIYSPYGSGAVVGLKSELNRYMPEFYGGGTVLMVADNWEKYQKAPALYEAGSPNYPGTVGLSKAIEILSEIGFSEIKEHEQKLMSKLVSGLKTFDNIVIYGDTDKINDRVGVLSFNFTDINSFFLAENLAKKGGVAVRRGAFCAHPYVWRLMHIPEDDLRGFVKCIDANTPGMIRVSFGIYNTEAEVDQFLDILKQVSDETRIRMKDTTYKAEY